MILEELRALPAGSPAVVSEAWLVGALGRIDDASPCSAARKRSTRALICFTGLPGFDALRSDLRFAALEQRLELSPSSAAPRDVLSE